MQKYDARDSSIISVETILVLQLKTMCSVQRQLSLDAKRGQCLAFCTERGHVSFKSDL